MEDKELDDAIATLEAFIDEAEKTCLALEAENADLRSGEYLARVIEERDRYRKALEDITRRYVELAGSGDCGFWDPETEDEVIAARAALEPTNEPT